jgi:hypothetical protein
MIVAVNKQIGSTDPCIEISRHSKVMGRSLEVSSSM